MKTITTARPRADVEVRPERHPLLVLADEIESGASPVPSPPRTVSLVSVCDLVRMRWRRLTRLCMTGLEL